MDTAEVVSNAVNAVENGSPVARVIGIIILVAIVGGVIYKGYQKFKAEKAKGDSTPEAIGDATRDLLNDISLLYINVMGRPELMDTVEKDEVTEKITREGDVEHVVTGKVEGNAFKEDIKDSVEKKAKEMGLDPAIAKIVNGQIDRVKDDSIKVKLGSHNGKAIMVDPIDAYKKYKKYKPLLDALKDAF